VKHHNLVPNTVGIRSTCNDGSHVLFLDFDKKNLDTVKESLRAIQRKYDAGIFYILRSSNRHYHAISIRKFLFGEVCEIQHKLKMDKYISFSARRGYWVLRVSKKDDKPEPKLVSILGSESKRSGSYAHWKWLFMLFQIPVELHIGGAATVQFDIYVTEIVK